MQTILQIIIALLVSNLTICEPAEEEKNDTAELRKTLTSEKINPVTLNILNEYRLI